MFAPILAIVHMHGFREVGATHIWTFLIFCTYNYIALNY